MKELLCVMVADDGDVSATTEFEFPKTGQGSFRDSRNHPMYSGLVAALRESPPDCHAAIRLLESARKEALYSGGGVHPELEKALKTWRRSRAAERGVPAFYVLHQRVLLGIADAAPSSAESLLAVPGFGPGLFARYGEEILEIVRNTWQDGV